MYIKLKDLKFSLDKARELSKQYDLMFPEATGPQKSVDKLRQVCSTYLKAEIKLFEIDESYEGKTIWGFYMRMYEGFYSIYISAEMNYCWQRFVHCKELFHAVLDLPEYRNMNIDEHIEEVTSTFPLLDSTPGSGAVSEIMAEIAAMEFLFPYSARVEELKVTSPDFMAIATKYRIPRVFVERYLSVQHMEPLGSIK